MFGINTARFSFHFPGLRLANSRENLALNQESVRALFPIPFNYIMTKNNSSGGKCSKTSTKEEGYS